MKIFHVQVPVTHVDGYQMFEVRAATEAGAIRKVKDGKAELIEDVLEVVGLDMDFAEVLETFEEGEEP